MKIIHTSDLHIGSLLTSRLAPRAAQIRRRELLSTLDKIIAEARTLGASVIIIAGDLFDSARVTKSIKTRIYNTIERACDISFIYTPGNHEGDTVIKDTIPRNLIVLSGEEWSYHTIENVSFAARSTFGDAMFDSYRPRAKVNIAILHAELGSYKENSIPPEQAKNRGLDYIALGHYHTYGATKIDEKCYAVYSGTPHGRGFDEIGEVGYVLIDTDTFPTVHKFMPLSSRRVFIRQVNITGAEKLSEIERRIRNESKDVKSADLLRIELVGERTPDFLPNTQAIYDIFANNYFHFEIKDNTRIKIDVEAIRYDKTLKGEFIRLVYKDDSLGEIEKDKIIDFGIRALMQETPDE